MIMFVFYLYWNFIKLIMLLRNKLKIWTISYPGVIRPKTFYILRVLLSIMMSRYPNYFRYIWRFLIPWSFLFSGLLYILRMYLARQNMLTFRCTWPHFPVWRSHVELKMSVLKNLHCFYLNTGRFCVWFYSNNW